MAFVPRTWVDGERVPAVDMNRIEQGIVEAASTGGPGGGGGSVDTVNGEPGPDVILTASDVGAALAVHTHIVDDVSGLQDLLDAKLETDVDGRIQPANLPRGSSFEIRWVAGSPGVWKYQNQTITARPLGLTHLYMLARGGPAAPPWQIFGDLWFEEIV